MLKHPTLGFKTFDIFASKFVRYLYKAMQVAVYFAILVGLFGSFILVINPSIDNDIANEIVKSLISKYDNLDAIQKDKIQTIFREIFIQK